MVLKKTHNFIGNHQPLSSPHTLCSLQQLTWKPVHQEVHKVSIPIQDVFLCMAATLHPCCFPDGKKSSNKIKRFCRGKYGCREKPGDKAPIQFAPVAQAWSSDASLTKLAEKCWRWLKVNTLPFGKQMDQWNAGGHWRITLWTCCRECVGALLVSRSPRRRADGLLPFPPRPPSVPPVCLMKTNTAKQTKTFGGVE